MTAGEPKTSFRPRSTYLGHLVVGSGDGAVLVEPSVAGELRVVASLAVARPAAGLLYGHVLHDDEGGYTLVDGFVPAETAGLFPVETDPWATRDRLREEAARHFPDASEVGWWRTAPRPGEETPPSEDGWPDPGAWPPGERPEGVGLVVFADGTPPATAGPVPHPVVQGTVLGGQGLDGQEPADWTPEDRRYDDGMSDDDDDEDDDEDRRFDDRLAPVPARPDPEQSPMLLQPVQPARATRGRIGPPVQSPQLIHPDELRTQRHQPEHGGLFDMEAQHWVLLAMVVLVLVIVITVGVMVSRVIH